MKPSRIAAHRVTAAAILASTAGLLAACGSSPSSSAQPAATVTVTTTATATATAPASSPAVTPQATRPPGPPGCATTALHASLGASGGAAGSIYYPVEFSNISSSTCSLYGYPGVSFVTAVGGSQIGKSAMEDPAFPRRLVTLAPGAIAHAELQVVVAQNYPASTCHPVAAHWLKVYPPGQTSALYISFTGTGCAAKSVQILSVQTVQPGNGGGQ